MDKYPLNWSGNKYKESLKFIDIDSNIDEVYEPFGGIFGFSRFYWSINPNCEFHINDHDTQLIEAHKRILENPDGLADEIEEFTKDWSDNKPSREIKQIIKDHPLQYYIENMANISNMKIYRTTKIRAKLKLLREAHKFKNMKLHFYNLDFRDFLNVIKPKDRSLIYIDPPYISIDNSCYKMNSYLMDNYIYLINDKRFYNLWCVRYDPLLDNYFKTHNYKCYTIYNKLYQTTKNKSQHCIYINF